MLTSERSHLLLKVMRVSNFLNFLGAVLGRYSGKALTLLIVEGNAARGVFFGEPDCGLAEAFLEDYRCARKRIFQWLGGAVLFALGAGTMALIAPRFFDQTARNFGSGMWPR
jgi:hypothetical protein